MQLRNISMALAAATMPFMANAADPLVESIIPVPEQVAVTEGLTTLANGTELYAWDTGGDGEVIVLAHPFSGNHGSWIYQQPVFVEAGYRVIGYSRRGYATSGRGPEGDIGSQSGDMAQLMDALGVEKAHIIGSAAGGSTALDFVLSYPERTLSGVVASSLLSIAEDDFRAAVGSARGDWFGPLPDTIKELSPSFRVTYPDGVKLWEDIYHTNPPRPEQMPVRQPMQASVTWETLAANEVPILFMTGGADLYMPPELLRRVTARTGNAEVSVMADVGHALFIEAPDEFNQIVLDFIGKH